MTGLLVENDDKIVELFNEATVLCANKLIDDESHVEESPLVYGPCSECIRETIQQGLSDVASS